ncbi:MAG: alpha-amylase family glycosyl hydrolase [Gemmatimonadaceae bacterium]
MSVRARCSLLLLTAIVSSATPATAQPRRDVSREQARTTPAWARDGVVYELNTRTFSATGDFNGIVGRLADLRALGVTVVWLMPVNPIGEVKKKGTIGSPYAVKDYYGVNPAFGTKSDLKRLVSEAHRQGLHVILDVVLNHTSWDNELLKTPAFYQRDAKGQVLSPYDWTDVAALDYKNPAVRKYMLDMLAYWVREFDVDGFRADVAFNVPTDFWEQARTTLEGVKPGLLMLAEAYEPELVAKAFDFDYSWPLYHAIADAATGSASARGIRAAWEDERRAYPRGALHLRFSDDHDEKRAIAYFGERGALAASALVFAMDGVPLLYNGQEVGDVTESGAPALFERLPVFWTGSERRPEFARFYRTMIPLRAAHAALRQGETTWLSNSDADRVVTFLRRDAGEEFLVAINMSNRPFAGTVEANGTFEEIPLLAAQGGPIGLPALALDAWGVRLFRRSR